MSILVWLLKFLVICLVGNEYDKWCKFRDRKQG